MSQAYAPDTRKRSRLTDFQIRQISVFRMRGYSIQETAAALRLSAETVKTYCRRHPELMEAPTTAEQDRCRNCGKPLNRKAMPRQKAFCCSECREQWWKEKRPCNPSLKNKPVLCAHCGVHFFGTKTHQRFCSHECYIQHRYSDSTAAG